MVQTTEIVNIKAIGLIQHYKVIKTPHDLQCHFAAFYFYCILGLCVFNVSSRVYSTVSFRTATYRPNMFVQC